MIGTQYKDKVIVIQGDNSSHEVSLKYLTDVVSCENIVRLFFDRPFASRKCKTFTFANEKEARKAYNFICEQWQ